MNITVKKAPSGIKKNKYHGHVILEFRSARTGIRERIERDNEFTDGITQYLTSGGYFANSPWANSDWRNVSIYHRLVGGVLLFDKPIPKINDKYPLFAPAGTKMIANGSYNVTNNSTVTEFGSYNSAESSFTADALTYVYDWTTSQGNGEIASVCLTSDVGGYIGYGNSISNVSMSTKRSIYYNQTSNSLSAEANYEYNVIDGVMYRATRRPVNDMTVTIIKTPISSCSLFTGGASETVTMPDEFVGNTGNIVLPVYGIGFAVFKFNLNGAYSQLSAGQTAKVAIYNVKTKAWMIRSIKAPASNTLTFYASNSQQGCVYGDWVVGIQRDTSTTANRCRVKLDTYDFAAYTTNTISSVGLGEDLFLTTGNNNDAYYMVDNANDTIYPVNGTCGNNGGGVSDDISMYLGANYMSIYRYRNPLYLATVCNLEETVQKTSDNTMKLIYTITRKE